MTAPYDPSLWGSWGEPLVHLGIGGTFGFLLERAGFGSAKKLTNQFYLNDMTVLKVMFTAIVTALALVTAATTLGLIEFDKLWVNPTYLGSGIVGGMLFGVGFVVGGYCPGTALVAASNLKWDGLVFIVGVVLGILGFGFSEPLVDQFYNGSGVYGRLTLADWWSVPLPVASLVAVGVALVFFAGGEAIERWMARRSGQPGPQGSARAKWLPLAAVMTLIVGSLVLWKPMQARRAATLEARAERSLRQATVQIDPRELADLMRDRRLSLSVLDLRSEQEFNRFHLVNAERVPLEALNRGRRLAPGSVTVLVDSDERQARQGYRQLVSAGGAGIYLLSGGIPAWLALFPPAEQRLQLALGADHRASRPPSSDGPPRYHALVQRPGMGRKKGGGCGG